MKASESYNVITDLEPYSDMYNSQFFAIATAFALVLATTVAGKAIGTAVSPSCCFFIPCEPDLSTHHRKTPSSQAPSSRALSRRETLSRLTLSRRAPTPQTALAPQVRLSSAATRPSILHASTDISSCVTVIPEKHATRAPMARVGIEGVLPAKCRGYKMAGIQKAGVERFVLSASCTGYTKNVGGHTTKTSLLTDCRMSRSWCSWTTSFRSVMYL